MCTGAKVTLTYTPGWEDGMQAALEADVGVQYVAGNGATFSSEGAGIYDSYIVQAPWIPAIVDGLENLSPLIAQSRSLDWLDVNSMSRQIVSFDNTVRALPLDTDYISFGYRADVFERWGKSPPETLEELVELSEFFSGKDHNNDSVPDWGFCLTPQPNYFYAFVAPVMQRTRAKCHDTQGDAGSPICDLELTGQNPFFDVETFQPLLDNPGFRYAFDLHARFLRASNCQDQLQSLGKCDRKSAMKSGRCAGVISMPGTMTKLLLPWDQGGVFAPEPRYANDGTTVEWEVGATSSGGYWGRRMKFPGSSKVYDSEDGALKDCTPELCPKAVPHSTMEGVLVNYAPFFAEGGEAYALRGKTASAKKEVMFHFFEWLANLPPSSVPLSGAYRRSQATQEAMTEMIEHGMPEQVASDLIELLQFLFRDDETEGANNVQDLLILGFAEYMRAFGTRIYDELLLQPEVFNGLLSEEEFENRYAATISTLEGDYEEINSEFGKVAQLQRWRTSLGLIELSDQELCGRFVEADEVNAEVLRKAGVDCHALLLNTTVDVLKIVVLTLLCLMGVILVVAALAWFVRTIRTNRRLHRDANRLVDRQVAEAWEKVSDIQAPFVVMKGSDVLNFGQLVPHETARETGKLVSVDTMGAEMQAGRPRCQGRLAPDSCLYPARTAPREPACTARLHGTPASAPHAMQKTGWVLLPLPYLVDALANRDVAEVVVLDACAASALLVASFLPARLVWSDLALGAVEASRMVAGSIVVPGAWSPFVAPSVMACFSMACAGVHSSILAACAAVAALADMVVASPGFEESAAMHALSCAYVVAAATVMEHRVAGHCAELRQRGYRVVSFGSGGAASRTLGGDVYYPVHDGSRLGAAASSSIAETMAFSDYEDDAHTAARLKHSGAHFGGTRLWSMCSDQQGEEQGYVPEPSLVSIAASPRAEGGAAPSAAEQLAAAERLAAAEQLAAAERLATAERLQLAAAERLAVAEQLASEQAAAPEQSYEHDSFDLSGALSAMQQVVHSLNSSGVPAASPRGLTYDDELQLASPADELAGAAGASPPPTSAVGSPPQPSSPRAGLPAVRLGGFQTAALNDLFVEGQRDELRVNDQPTFWSTRGWFLYHNPQTRTWGVAKASRLDRVREGQTCGLAHSPEGYDLLGGAVLGPPGGWREWDAEAGQWVKRLGSGLQSRGKVREQPTDAVRGPAAPARPAAGAPTERTGPPPRAVEPSAAELHGSHGPAPRDTLVGDTRASVDCCRLVGMPHADNPVAVYTVRREHLLLHKVLRLPPSTFRKADLLALTNWLQSPAPAALQAYALSVRWRAATATVTGWRTALQRLAAEAEEQLPVTRWRAGDFSPPFWALPRAIAQEYASLVAGEAQLQVPARRLQTAIAAAEAEKRTAAMMMRKPKLQTCFCRSLAASLFPESLVTTLRKRLRAWGLGVPPALEARWSALRAVLVRAPPSWQWAALKTLGGGWTTAGRIHIMTPRPCLFGCECAADDIRHYLVCRRLWHWVALPRSFLPGPLGRLGLGSAAEHAGEWSRGTALRGVVLAFHIYHLHKKFFDKHGRVVPFDAASGIRLAALHRLRDRQVPAAASAQSSSAAAAPQPPAQRDAPPRPGGSGSGPGVHKTKTLPLEGALGAGAEGALERSQEAFLKRNYVIFFSHQWLSWEEPDPSNVQFAALQAALQTISARTGKRLDELYVWCDWFSIPQKCRAFQKMAIASLPVFASICHCFVALVPDTEHADTNAAANRAAFHRRTWCRAEVMSHWARRGTENMFYASGEGLQPMAPSSPTDEFLEAIQVFHGDLTCCCRGHKGGAPCDREFLIRCGSDEENDPDMDPTGWDDHVKGLIDGHLRSTFASFKNEITGMVASTASVAATQAVDPVMAAIRTVEDAVKSVPATCQQKVEASLRPELAAMERRFQTQLDGLNARVSSLDSRTEKMHDELGGMHKQMDELRNALALAHRAPPPPKPPAAGFHREVDATVLKIVASSMVKRKDVHDSIKAWLDKSKIEGWEVQGEEQDRLFTLQFTGPVAVAGRRAVQALGALRLPGKGNWMRFPVPGASGGSTQLHVGADKNPFQIKREIAGKKITAVLREKYPDAKLFFDRQNGWISESWNPILRLEPQPGQEATKCYWNDAALATRGWTRDEIKAAITNIITPNGEPEWSL
ncbi:unnamed protein product [Prorocentrum cordatum]|uniref:Uncharacterized protein n=1 Tax=Prorocentrum cordatum TaxID=2364126 RepID=A0ABN9XYD3_9DINO|nr:unnamed protein product [Polarella glacialis]